MQRTVNASLLLVGVCIGGLLFSASWARGEPRTHSPYHALTTLAKVLAHVQASYVDEVDENSLVMGAIRGLVHSLDPHSAYMSPEEFRVLRADTEGRFGGIGCEVDLRSGVLFVMTPLDGSPAARAGLRPRDRIVEIDGQSTEGMTLQEAVVRMRGEAGTAVRLVIRRPGEEEPRELSIERAIIRVEPVEARVMDVRARVGYVRLRMFQEETAARLHEELDRLERELGSLEGLVLDLRGNPGGLVDQAVEVCDEFLADGVIVVTRGRGGHVMAEERAHRRGTRRPFPIVVLVDGQSASASEIVVGALQDHHRAIILGTRTYGKGSVQNVIELPDGSGLKLTVARYYTPRGRSIDGLGIEPDVVVEDPQADSRAGEVGEQRPDPLEERALHQIQQSIRRRRP